MIVARSKAELRGELEATPPDATVGLVPTMGALHDGHLSLLAAARQRCDVVVMSLFVNPTQFRPGEDLAAYPRDEERDLALADEAGVDIVFAPPVDEVYPEGFATAVEVSGGLVEVLDGDRDRRGPEHFRGVTTVVAKLLNCVGPDFAYFGQKDAQQALIVRRMVADLDFPVEIVVVPTVREPDGLAMSSRNAYLEGADRERASALNRALQAIEASVAAGERDTERALEHARSELTAAGIEPEYLEARDAERLERVEHFDGAPVLVAVAARVGPARLIDNVVINPKAGSDSVALDPKE